MRRITPETFGPEYHAAGVALCHKIRRTLRPQRHKPIIAWIIGEGPRPAHVPDPHAKTTTEQEAA